MAVLSISNTALCNMALAKIGSKRINNFEDTTESSVEAIHCRTHYEQTRDSLLRSHFWRFARARKVLSQDTADDPLGEWDNQFILPNDFMRFRSIYEEEAYSSKSRRHSIEGQRFLTNFSTVNMRYIKKVIDPTEFDPLFVEVLVLLLARKLVGPLAGGAPKLKAEIKDDLKTLMPSVWAIDSDETDVGGRSDWNLARFGGLGVASQDERFW